MTYDKQIFESPKRAKAFAKFIQKRIDETTDPELKQTWAGVLKTVKSRIRYFKRHVWPK